MVSNYILPQIELLQSLLAFALICSEISLATRAIFCRGTNNRETKLRTKTKKENTTKLWLTSVVTKDVKVEVGRCHS